MPSSDIALTNRNAKNGKYGLPWNADGDVTFDETLEHEVMCRLVEHRGRWLGDADGTQGSRLYTLRQGSSTASRKSDAEAFAREALQPMLDAKTLTLDKVEATPRSAGRVDVTVFWTPRGGQQKQTTVSL